MSGWRWFGWLGCIVMLLVCVGCEGGVGGREKSDAETMSDTSDAGMDAWEADFDELLDAVSGSDGGASDTGVSDAVDPG